MDFVTQFLYISVGLLFLMFAFVDKAECGEDKQQEIKCHTNANSSETPTVASTGTLKLIDDALDKAYSAMKVDGDYKNDCTYKIPNNTNSANDNVDDFNFGEITLLLEEFEIKRKFYVTGKYGFCAEQAAKKLIKRINSFHDTISGKNVVICNREKLLTCHAEYEKCLCMTENRNFRNWASQYWEDDDNPVEKRLNIENQCVLDVGSNCPIASESPFQCYPGTNCLFKHDLSPCVNRNIRGKGNKILGRSKRESARYSFLKDIYPSVYCQCYGYEKTLPNGSSLNDFNRLCILIFGITSIMLSVL